MAPTAAMLLLIRRTQQAPATELPPQTAAEQPENLLVSQVQVSVRKWFQQGKGFSIFHRRSQATNKSHEGEKDFDERAPGLFELCNC